MGRRGTVCRAAQPAAVVGGPSRWVVPRAGSQGSRWLPGCLPRALSYLGTFSWKPLLWAEPWLREALPTGPRLLNSPTCHRGRPRDSQGLEPGSEEPAEPCCSPGAPSFLGEGQMQLLKGCSPRPPPSGVFSGSRGPLLVQARTCRGGMAPWVALAWGWDIAQHKSHRWPPSLDHVAGRHRSPMDSGPRW